MPSPRDGGAVGEPAPSVLAPAAIAAATGGSGLVRDAWRRLRKNRAAVASGAILAALLLLCIVQPAVAERAYHETDLALGSRPPSWRNLLGTDSFGRDLLTRACFGGRISFAVGIIATLVSFAIGVVWGGVAGYFGGRIDAIMMRLVDALYTFPFIVFVILILVFFGTTASPLYGAYVAALGLFVSQPRDPGYFPVFQIVLVFAALGGISWLTMARIVRGQVISLKAQPFVEAARSIGVGPARLIARHLLPNALGPILVYTTLVIPEVMLVEAFLSFLGIGTQEPLSSWGSLVALGAEVMGQHPWQLVVPSAFLAITLFCFNFLGDGLRDALDPRMRKD